MGTGVSTFLNSFITFNMVLALFSIGLACLIMGIAWLTNPKVFCVPSMIEPHFIPPNSPLNKPVLVLAVA